MSQIYIYYFIYHVEAVNNLMIYVLNVIYKNNFNSYIDNLIHTNNNITLIYQKKYIYRRCNLNIRYVVMSKSRLNLYLFQIRIMELE